MGCPLTDTSPQPAWVLEQDGLVRYYRDFIAASETPRWFHQLRQEIQWCRETYKIYGRDVHAPRLVAWYGDADAVYRYSGVVHQPRPWTAGLAVLRDQVSAFTGELFNAVLCNLYRDGNDSVGWHADKEAELGPQPAIASLSLGAPRLFKMRHNRSKAVHDLLLEPGSLLVMTGAFQQQWRHTLPKSRQVQGPRINLTFRHIVQVPAQAARCPGH